MSAQNGSARNPRCLGISSAKSTLSNAGRILRDWSPFVFLLLFYHGFRAKLWMLIMPVDLDDVLLDWDRRLFGETPSVWTEAITVPWLTDILSVAYFSHLVLPALIGIVWYAKKTVVFREFLLTSSRMSQKSGPKKNE